MKKLTWFFIAILSSSHSWASLINLSDVRTSCLKHPNITLVKLDREVALKEIDASSVDTDLIGFSSYSVKNYFSKPYTTLENPVLRDITSGPALGLKKKFFWGTQAEISVQDLTIKTTSRNAVFFERHQTAFLLKLETPLLKGAGESIVKNKYFKSVQRGNIAISKLRFTTNETLKNCYNSFSNYYEFKKTLFIKENEFKVAKRIHSFDDAKFKNGAISEMDYLTSKAALKRKEASYLMTAVEYEKTKWELANFLEADLDKAELTLVTMGNVSLAPTNATNFPQYYQLYFEAKSQEVDYVQAKNGVLPQLNLNMEFLSTGLSDDSSLSREQVQKYTYPSVEVSLVFTYPLENIRAEEEKNIQNFKKDQFTYRLLKLKHELEGKEKNLISQIAAQRAAYDHEASLLKREELVFKHKEVMYQNRQLAEHLFEEALVNLDQKKIDFLVTQKLMFQKNVELLALRGKLREHLFSNKGLKTE